MSDKNVGGAANEQGSLHRNGAAAFFAVHGMLGRPILGRSEAIPKRIYLEASEDVDDIIVEMTTGAKWYIQCKRRVGVDSQLEKTLDQWCKQQYERGDHLGLVAGEFRGVLRDIQETIDHLNDEQRPPVNVTQQTKIDALRAKLQGRGCSDPEQVIRDALFLRVATESPSDDQQQNACALLGSIVAPNQADAAFQTLRAFMQVSAANRRWTNVKDWVGALSDAGIEVTAEVDGIPASAAVARSGALDAYRNIIARRRDLLSLSTLRPELADVYVENLLGGWNVQFGDDHHSSELLRLVRRNARFVLTGFPGLGKSEALRQLAAHLASDMEAPLPVLIDLKDSLVTIQSGGSLTLDGVLRQLSNQIPQIDPMRMVTVLREELLSGNAILLVDGLDETRSRRGRVADDIVRILRELPPKTGFVLSTRPSAADAAGRLMLPTVELESPASLDRSLSAVIEASVPMGVSDREEWIKERIARVRAARKGADDIWKVPLLATLAAIRVAEGKGGSVDSVGLLGQVIDDSVQTWEQSKAKYADGFDTEMRPSMLAKGFTTIGCLVNTTTPTIDDAEVAVERQLESWTFSAPLRKELARQVVHFWDERVGVFVKRGITLTARSRQFAELADARRVGDLSEPEKKAWVMAAVGDADLRQTVQLATQGDQALRIYLLDAAGRGAPVETRSRAAQWAVDFAPGWPVMSLKSEKRVIDLIADASEDKLALVSAGTSFLDNFVGGSRSDGAWHFAIRLARLIPVESLFMHKRERLESLELAAQQREVLNLYMVLTDARKEERVLNDTEVAQVVTLLDMAAPVPSPATYRKGVLVIDAGFRYIEGVSDVVELAAEYVNQLPAGYSDKLAEVSKHLSGRTFERVRTSLVQRGYSVGLDFLTDVTGGLDSFQEFEADYHGLGWLLRLLDRMLDEEALGIPPEPWRWGEISELISVVRWGELTTGSSRRLMEVSEDLQSVWVDVLIDVYGLDRWRLAQEIRAILASGDDEVLWQITTPRLTRREPVRTLTEREAIKLARCFASGSEDMVLLTAQLTVNTGYRGVSEVIESLSIRMSWQNRFFSTVVSIATSAVQSELIERYRQSHSPQRAAVAMVLAARSSGEQQAILDKLREDRDAAVRFQCGGDVRQAEVWTCRYCHIENPITQDSCEKCHLVSSWIR